MAKRKQVTRKQRDSVNDLSEKEQVRRAALLDGIVIGTMQKPEEGLYSDDMLRNNRLIKPPYDPVKLYKVTESSSILPQSLDAMVRNIDGFGYELQYIGPPDKEKDQAVIDERDGLQAFFNKVNERESFKTVRESMRQDSETTGNGYLEIIRMQDNFPGLIYHMDTRYVRLQAIQSEPEEIKVELFRGGKERTISIYRRFRKFAMITSRAKKKIRWFKEFGDLRKMDAITGKYENELRGGESIKEEASEVIHFKLGNDTYGVPRWSGQILNILGMNSADYVNWDLFENQVVPPLAVLVSGGTLTTETIKDIKSVLLQKKGVQNFNKILILEAQSEGNINDKTATKVDLKELSVARKEDAMFVAYTEKGEHRVRGSFRLPPLYLGRADAYSKSTADSSRMIAEEQIFVPERMSFDEVVNVLLMPDLGAKHWKFVTKGPRLITGEEMITGFKEFSKVGVFTINEGIRLANKLLGMDITLYEQTWADYPIPIVIELARMGLLRELDEISTMSGELGNLLQEGKVSDPEKAAQLYAGLSKLRSVLVEIADKRIRADEEIEESSVRGAMEEAA